MSQHANRVQMTVASAPGTSSPITLGSATTGYQSFGAGYNNTNATVDILITEGANWEICRNCTYTHSGTTVTRTTPEASSAGGAAVSFGSSAIVSVIATAATGNNWGLNEIKAAVTGSNVTGVVGTLHILDLSGLTADRDFVLPATCAVGDRIGVFVEVGDASHELLLKPDGSDTINGGAAGAEWSRVFITGECVIFRCVTANSAWIVEYDGRIPCQMSFDLSTNESGTKNGGTYYAPTSVNGVWTVVKNIGDCGDSSTSRFNVRRDGSYLFTASWGSTSSPADGTVNAIRFTDGTVQYGGWLYGQGVAGTVQMATTHADFLTVGKYIEMQTRSGAASAYASTATTWFSAMEIL
jgi:hypothetical protein